MQARSWSDDMKEISGFGGGYEEACRAMLLAGRDWIDAHPNEVPEFHEYAGICGVIIEDNQAAKDLTKAILDACPEGATGAMHQAVVSHCLFIRSNGWNAYVAKMSGPSGS